MTQETEPRRQNVILPRAEWEAFLDDVKRLISSDEQLLEAYGQLLASYEELMSRSGGPRREPRSGGLGIRRLFRRRQPPQPMIYMDQTPQPTVYMDQSPQTGTYVERSAGLLCPNCGADLETNDRFCRACGRVVQAFSGASGAGKSSSP